MTMHRAHAVSPSRARDVASHSPAPARQALRANRLLARAAFVQRSVEVSQPSDELEREADRVADHVMRMPAPTVQRSACGCGGACGPCAARMEDDDGAIHRAPSGQSPAATSEAPQLGAGRVLDAQRRSFLEPRLGADLSGVRVHLGNDAARSARSYGALAYTYGNHVVFGAGQYALNTDAGRRLMAHELTRVVPQSAEPDHAV